MIYLRNLYWAHLSYYVKKLRTHLFWLSKTGNFQKNLIKSDHNEIIKNFLNHFEIEVSYTFSNW